MNMKNFVDERNSALLSFDKGKIEQFAKKWGIALPTSEEAFWRGVHKAVCSITDIPFEVRQKSADWLSAHGSTPEIFGGHRNGEEYIKRKPILKFIEDGLNNPDTAKAFGHDAIEIMSEVQYAPAAEVVEIPSTGIGDLSDGYHTFNELYHHRAVLFAALCNTYPDRAWKSMRHQDGNMYEGMFIVGIETPGGQATYHYDVVPYWDMFDVKVLPRAPEWDGHTPSEALRRILTLTIAEKTFVDEYIRGNGMTFKQVADLISLYKGGGIPLAPVKIGDKVWFICWDKVAKAWNVDETPYTIEEVGVKGFFVSYDEEEPVEFDEYVLFDDIGDECFLSLELAKAAAAVKEEPVLQEEEADETEG